MTTTYSPFTGDSSLTESNCSQNPLFPSLLETLLATSNTTSSSSSSSWNCSADLPPAKMDQVSVWIRLSVLMLYGIVCIVGLCGNTLVIYVVIRFSKMHTVTNLYIVNLAIADECFLVGLPFLMTTTAMEYWPFGKFMCKMYFTTTGVNQVTSSMFLLIMSADRFIAVCHPISATKWRTPMISSFVTATAWALSAVIMVPIFIFATTRMIGNKNSCNIFWPEWMDDTTFMLYSFLVTFAVPFILISVFYVLVIFRLRNVGPKRSLPTPTNQNYKAPAATGSQENSLKGTAVAAPHAQPPKNNRARDRKKSHRKVTKLVLTVITVYFLCWAPYWGLQLALASMENEITHSSSLLTIFLLAACLSYSNSAMNPILYAFLSDNFKKSFMKACSCASRRDVNAMLHGETSAGLPRVKSAERRKRRMSKSKLLHQQKLVLLHGKSPGGVESSTVNGLATPRHGDLLSLVNSPSAEGLQLRPCPSASCLEMEDTEILHSPMVDDEDRLFGCHGDGGGDTDEDSDPEIGGACAAAAAASAARHDVEAESLIDMGDDSVSCRTNGSRGLFGGGSSRTTELFKLSPMSTGDGAAAAADTFVKDGVHMTEL